MRIMSFLMVLVLIIPLVTAPNVKLLIEESGKVTSYFNTYWVVQVNGTATLSNPSNNDLFDVRLYYDLLSLQILKVSGEGEVSQGSVSFSNIPADSSVSFDYSILGISAQSPTLDGKGVLYTAFSKRNPKIYTDVFGNLQKASLEDSSITGRSGRLVSVTLRNPNNLPLTIESMRVIKTSADNPNIDIASWSIINSSSPRVIEENGFFVHDILDKNSSEGQIYWLQSDVFISSVDLVDNNSLIRLSEKNLTVPVEAFNFTNESDNYSRLLVSSNYFLRKDISDSLIVPNKVVSVTLTLYNLGSELTDYSLSDSLPAGFTSSDLLSWSGSVPALGSISKSYNTSLNISSLPGVDVFPSAVAFIDGVTVKSPPVPFIRQFSPDDRIYVQKSLEQAGVNTMKVSILVQNLGQKPLEGAMLKEFLETDDVFSQITQLPVSKGLWSLPMISAGDSWEVSYTTSVSDRLTSLPMLYGVEPDRVLRTIILNNIVSEGWNFVSIKIVELAGILAVIIIPLLLFFRKKR